MSDPSARQSGGCRVKVVFDRLTADGVIDGVREQIKRRGAFLVVSEAILPGTEIRFEFLLGDGKPLASGMAVVRMFLPEHMAVCLEFTGFDDEDSRAFIRRFQPGLPWERQQTEKSN